MPYLIGMDEAGYGPNLGPLVISVAVWHVRGDPGDADLYGRLDDVITRTPSLRDHRIPVADSKTLYKSGQGLRLLERGLLSAVALCHPRVTDWTELWQVLAADTTGQRSRLPWCNNFELALPLASDDRELAESAENLRRGCVAAHVRLDALQSRALFPARFNTLVERFGTKSEVLSRSSIGLLADVLRACRDEPVRIVGDKHGGRNRYAALLQRQFPESLIEVCHEGRVESVYRWGPPAARVEIAFRVGGEAFLPTALASMASKYLRELAMRAENDFWCRRVAGLRPTAGYPVDARRFKAAIAACQRQLGIDDHAVWRTK